MARVADELIRPMLRALDDLPVHGRQLGDMVRGLRGQQRRNRDGVEEIDTFDVTLKPFKRNRKHDPAEYTRQYDEQMDALQQMPVSDWIRNRTEYLQNGRTPDSLRAQENAREAALKAKILELREITVALDLAGRLEGLIQLEGCRVYVRRHRCPRGRRRRRRIRSCCRSDLWQSRSRSRPPSRAH